MGQTHSRQRGLGRRRYPLVDVANASQHETFCGARQRALAAHVLEQRRERGDPVDGRMFRWREITGAQNGGGLDAVLTRTHAL